MSGICLCFYIPQRRRERIPAHCAKNPFLLNVRCSPAYRKYVLYLHLQIFYVLNSYFIMLQQENGCTAVMGFSIRAFRRHRKCVLHSSRTLLSRIRSAIHYSRGYTTFSSKQFYFSNCVLVGSVLSLIHI